MKNQRVMCAVLAASAVMLLAATSGTAGRLGAEELAPDVGFGVDATTNNDTIIVSDYGPGHPTNIVFDVIITNTGTLPETVTVNVSSTMDWPITLSGYDNSPILPKRNMTVTLAVAVPPGKSAGIVEEVTVEAACQERPSVSDSVLVRIVMEGGTDEGTDQTAGNTTQTTREHYGPSNTTTMLAVALVLGCICAVALYVYRKKRLGRSGQS